MYILRNPLLACSSPSLDGEEELLHGNRIRREVNDSMAADKTTTSKPERGTESPAQMNKTADDADIIRSAVLPILMWEKVPWEQGGRRLLANVLNFCLFYVSPNGVYIRPVSQIANMVKFSIFKS